MLLYVNYEHKTIIPIDLKTSSKKEWDFPKSFIEWRYMIQACMYWFIIRQNLDNDEYFKDFKLENYRFIVINKETPKVPVNVSYTNENKIEDYFKNE